MADADYGLSGAEIEDTAPFDSDELIEEEEDDEQEFDGEDEGEEGVD